MITAHGVSVRWTDVHRHKFDTALSEWVFEHYEEYADRDTGSTEAPMGHVLWAGRRLFFTDDRGFVSCDTYPDKAGAEQVFDALDLWYGAWEFDGDMEELGFPASMGDYQRFCRYVIECATENLEARPFMVWFEFDQPKGPLG